MAKIFISYRRDDSAYVADTINAEVRQHFGPDSVFFDIHNIPLGADFRKHLEDAIAQCDVLLVIIGDHWLGQTDDHRQRRLEDPLDYVRIEIESALKRKIPVVPVLVGQATMPPPDNLPFPIQELAYRNKTEIRSGPDLHQHLDRLIQGLELICGPSLRHNNMQAEQTATNGSNETKNLNFDSDTLQAIQKIRVNHHDPRLYVSPNIPSDKLANAIAKYANTLIPEDVLLLYDSTVSGSAKDGFCLTVNGIYWNAGLFGELFGDRNQMAYGQMEKIGAVGWGPWASIRIDGRKFSVDGRGVAQSMVSLLLTLRSNARRSKQKRD